MSYLRHINNCNIYHADGFQPFVVSGKQVGEVRHAFANKLVGISDQFLLENNILHWQPVGGDFESLTGEMAELTELLLAKGLLHYRHNELYPVTTGQRENALFLMDRALVPYFGVRAFGQHINGFVRQNDEIHMWIARRSMNKRNEPGKLDNLVAGGLPWNLGLEENLAKECWEEAGIPVELASQARLTGHISYRCEIDYGLKPDTMYCYDLELPADFTPRCTDGEVDEFYLWPVEKVAQRLLNTDDIKRNCNLVIIDFMIRHGYIDREYPEYSALIAGLTQPDISP
jgi:8-oxo-dGTP pyrophosphatase MutT (NUDIX family)